jgi:hypothetical protein
MATPTGAAGRLSDVSAPKSINIIKRSRGHLSRDSRRIGLRIPELLDALTQEDGEVAVI